MALFRSDARQMNGVSCRRKQWKARPWASTASPLPEWLWSIKEAEHLSHCWNSLLFLFEPFEWKSVVRSQGHFYMYNNGVLLNILLSTNALLLLRLCFLL
uniref:Uncharacterized protein n=1 Tax=Heterorhabditis bacteriophora TaxID=37862 RepID=A0A1I7WBY9_HETBA